MTDTEITERIIQNYPSASVEVSGADCNFKLMIRDESLGNLSMVKRQQAIYRLFKAELASGELHAIALDIA